MSIQQAEGWHLWKKSIVMPRQALRHTVVSVLQRDHLASLLVVLLTGTGLLGTPAFGRSRDEIVADARHKAVEAQRRMRDESCMLHAQCAIDAGRVWGEAMWCMQYPETCGASEEPKAPAPVGCPDGYVPIMSCLSESYIPIEFEEESTPKPLACPEGYIPFEFEEGKELIQACVGYPSEPSPSCPLGYDEDSQKIVQICNTAEFDSYVKKQAHFTLHRPLCKADDIIPWEVARRICEINANDENQKRCAWHHPFYTSPIIQDVMQTWEMTTMVEVLACGTIVVAPPMVHYCVTAAVGWAGKKLVKWLALKWPASKPVCFELAEIERACDAWATEVVCTDRR
jgi:hypothetical protein